MMHCVMRLDQGQAEESDAGLLLSILTHNETSCVEQLFGLELTHVSSC